MRYLGIIKLRFQGGDSPQNTTSLHEDVLILPKRIDIFEVKASR